MNQYKMCLLVLAVFATLATSEAVSNITESNRDGKSMRLLFRVFFFSFYYHIDKTLTSFGIFNFSFFSLLHRTIQKFRMQESKHDDQWTDVSK